MKTLITALLIIGGCLAASAQTISVSQVPDLLPTNGWAKAVDDALAFAEGVGPSNSVVQVEAGILRGQTSHKIGAFADVMLPVGGTNSLFGAGFGLAYYNKNFYDATLNARLGGTLTLPIIKFPVYTYLESGGGWNLSQNRAIAQAFTGFTISYAINPHWTITGGAALGTVSDLGEMVEALGGSATYSF